MALPYKLLKSITIDGTTMGLDDKWGSSTFKSQYISLPANTRTKGAEITISEPGLYLLTSRFTFGASSTTGSKKLDHEISAKFNGASDYSLITRQVLSNQNNTTESVVNMALVYNFSEAQVPASIACFGISTVASGNGYTNIQALKLVNMGGVIRTLKNLGNSICYRPLNFGKAVA